MMKPLLIAVVLSLCWKLSAAQVVIALLFGDKLNTDKLEFGLVVTPSFTNISGMDSKNRNGLTLGIYFNFRPDKRFYIHAEGIAKGAFGATSIAPYPTGNDSLDALFHGGEVERKIQSFGLPLLCRYRLVGKLYAEAGVQADWILNAHDIFKVKQDGNPLEYTKTTSSDYTTLDFGVAAGLFYKFSDYTKSMGLGLRYMHGLTDIYKPLAGTQSNYMWQLDLSIPIGAGKPPAKKTATTHS
jgi:hypothetical protein